MKSIRYWFTLPFIVVLKSAILVIILIYVTLLALTTLIEWGLGAYVDARTPKTRDEERY